MNLPNLDMKSFKLPDINALRPDFPTHKPRILLLYGSVRERSYSRFLTLEAQLLLDAMGAETRVFHANGLPLPDDGSPEHSKVQEL